MEWLLFNLNPSSFPRAYRVLYSIKFQRPPDPGDVHDGVYKISCSNCYSWQIRSARETRIKGLHSNFNLWVMNTLLIVLIQIFRHRIQLETGWFLKWYILNKTINIKWKNLQILSLTILSV